MKTLHQQLADARAAFDKAAVAAAAEQDPRTAAEISQRAAGIANERARLETDAELGEAAARDLQHALNYLRAMCAGRELCLAINAAEVAAFRLRNHLGERPADPVS